LAAGKWGRACFPACWVRSSSPSTALRPPSRTSRARNIVAKKYGVKAHTNNVQAVRGADLVLIALKPQQVAGVLREVKKVLRKDAVIISAAASVTTALIERELGHPAHVVRAMPNNTLPDPTGDDGAGPGHARNARRRGAGAGDF